MTTTTAPASADTRQRLARLVDDNDLIIAGPSEEFWHSNLFELGLVDSMGVVFLLELIQEDFGVELDISMLTAELSSLAALADYLGRR